MFECIPDRRGYKNFTRHRWWVGIEILGEYGYGYGGGLPLLNLSIETLGSNFIQPVILDGIFVASTQVHNQSKSLSYKNVIKNITYVCLSYSLIEY